jgi:nucleoside-diphosphate-sugar epimerase
LPAFEPFHKTDCSAIGRLKRNVPTLSERREGPGGPRLLITGGAGFLGSHLCRQLRPEQALVVDRVGEWRRRFPGCEQIPIVRAELTKLPAVAQKQITAFRPEVLIHLAADLGREGDPKAAFRCNTDGLERLLDVLADAPLRQVVLSSSSEVYGSQPGPLTALTKPLPRTLYGRAKLAQEEIVRAWCDRRGIASAVLRFLPLYGPGMAESLFLAQALAAAWRGADLPMSPGEQRYEFIEVDGAVEALLAAMRHRFAGTVTVATGEVWRLIEVAELVFALTGRGGRPLPGALPYREHEKFEHFGDPAEARRELGWQAQRTLREGLAALARLGDAVEAAR